LYPDRELARFTDKNNIPEEYIAQSNLLQQLLSNGNNQILSRDIEGRCHFDGSFRNQMELEDALEQLDDVYQDHVKQEKDLVVGFYEQMFDHKSFTGRSGTFFGYEGLGSIYWHMVSKLLLATQECYFTGLEKGDDQHLLDRLKEHYFEIKAGIGWYKSPDVYGAFPN
jgi:hypothetical protein